MDLGSLVMDDARKVHSCQFHTTCYKSRMKLRLNLQLEMSHSSIFSSNSSENDPLDDISFEIDDYLTFDEDPQEAYASEPPLSQQNHSLPLANAGNPEKSTDNSSIRKRNELTNISRDKGSRVVFRTKSELEIMDDGYKWRKYGKKMMKNNPHPRNYYRCMIKECNVKKRVQRERDDSSYVITTYEGVHNHQRPSEQHVPHHLTHLGYTPK